MKQESKVLLVSYNKNLVDRLAKGLSKKNYKVWTAYSGEEGLDILKRISIDLIISDVHLSNGMDGYNFF